VLPVRSPPAKKHWRLLWAAHSCWVSISLQEFLADCSVTFTSRLCNRSWNHNTLIAHSWEVKEVDLTIWKEERMAGFDFRELKVQSSCVILTRGLGWRGCGCVRFEETGIFLPARGLGEKAKDKSGMAWELGSTSRESKKSRSDVDRLCYPTKCGCGFFDHGGQLDHTRKRNEYLGRGKSWRMADQWLSKRWGEA
jgi:hypothetical protein